MVKRLGWVLAAAGLSMGAAAWAAVPISGSFEVGIAFNPNAPSVSSLVQTDSDTFAQLTFNWDVDGWSFSSRSRFDMSGLTRQEFSASGALEVIKLNSRLTFFPVLGSASSLITRSKTINTNIHEYDLGQLYFVDWVSATVKAGTPATHWHLSISTDGESWEQVSPAFSGSCSSGQISVGRFARYVRIEATDGAGVYLDESTMTAAVAGYAWTTSARLVAAGVTLDSRFALASSGSSLSLTFTGPDEGELTIAATVYFKITDLDCILCFDRVQGEIGFGFGCLEEITATWKVSKFGFQELTFSVRDVDLGLPLVKMDLKVSFGIASKTVTVTPKLDLEDFACLTLHANLEFGPAGPIELSGLTIYGIGLKCSWEGGSFESISYLDGLHYVKDRYWERITIRSTGISCCGGQLSFEVNTYFGDTHATLFDWAETELKMSVEIEDYVTFSTTFTLDTNGFSEWKIGWKTSW